MFPNLRANMINVAIRVSTKIDRKEKGRMSSWHWWPFNWPQLHMNDGITDTYPVSYSPLLAEEDLEAHTHPFDIESGILCFLLFAPSAIKRRKKKQSLTMCDSSLCGFHCIGFQSFCGTEHMCVFGVHVRVSFFTLSFIIVCSFSSFLIMRTDSVQRFDINLLFYCFPFFLIRCWCCCVSSILLIDWLLILLVCSAIDIRRQ